MAEPSHWEHFPHEADIGIRGIGSSREQAFEQAAMALTAAVCDPASVRPRESLPIQCLGEDDELLFVNWIDALIFEMSTRKMLFSGFDVHIDGRSLAAIVRGEPIDLARHRPAAEVKGATLTALRVTQRPDGFWLAQCVVDV